MPMNFQIARIRFIKFLIDINEMVFFERRLHRFYKKKLINSIRTVIDVGANKGQSINFFLKLNPDCVIYALEPNPVLYDFLTKKYRNQKNIRIFNFGISERSGEKLFFENIFDYTSSFEDLNIDSGYLRRKAKILGVKPENIIGKKYPVEVLTLSDFIQKNHIQEEIDILKIDTEGHEYYCLQGLFIAQQPVRVKYIQIENHNDDMYKNRVPFSKINDLLEENGFSVIAKVRHGFGNLDEVIYKRQEL
jgi:FkbM family methyltransferase